MYFIIIYRKIKNVPLNKIKKQEIWSKFLLQPLYNEWEKEITFAQTTIVEQGEWTFSIYTNKYIDDDENRKKNKEGRKEGKEAKERVVRWIKKKISWSTNYQTRMIIEW